MLFKDLVSLEDGNYICFSCWNKYNKEKDEKINDKTN